MLFHGLRSSSGRGILLARRQGLTWRSRRTRKSSAPLNFSVRRQENMTATARKVLHDLQVAHELLEVEENAERFRILWVATTALARAVGHVLQKVDSDRSPKLRVAIAQLYKTWKANSENHRIFFEFIEDERNSVLKEYEFGFLSGPVEVVVLPDGLSATLDENLFCPLSVGRYAGEDCRDVMGLAINWWQTQLEAIDCATTA